MTDERDRRKGGEENTDVNRRLGNRKFYKKVTRPKLKKDAAVCREALTVASE